MIEDGTVRLGDLIEAARKPRRAKTLGEIEDEKLSHENLRWHCKHIVLPDGKERALDIEQSKFVFGGFMSRIIYDQIPRLEKVLEVFGMNAETMFYYETEETKTWHGVNAVWYE